MSALSLEQTGRRFRPTLGVRPNAASNRLPLGTGFAALAFLIYATRKQSVWHRHEFDSRFSGGRFYSWLFNFCRKFWPPEQQGSKRGDQTIPDPHSGNRRGLIGRAMSEFEVELEDGNIAVSLQGTHLKAIYQKSSEGEALVLLSSWMANAPDAPMTPEEFRVRAEQAANAKARELGWFI